MKATWIRLDNGSWGVCVESALGSIFDAIVGQEVEVTRRDGDVSFQRVTAIVKRIDPRPAKRVRGRTIRAVTAFLAICEVEPREKAPARKGAPKRNGRKYQPRMTSAAISAELDSLELEQQALIQRGKEIAQEMFGADRSEMVNVDGVGFDSEPPPAADVSFADLLARPLKLSPESTLTRA